MQKVPRAEEGRNHRRTIAGETTAPAEPRSIDFRGEAWMRAYGPPSERYMRPDEHDRMADGRREFREVDDAA